MSEISGMDWAQHIKMDYAQNLRKDSEMGKKRPSAHFTGLQYQEFAVISSNLIKTSNFKSILAPWVLDLTK